MKFKMVTLLLIFLNFCHVNFAMAFDKKAARKKLSPIQYQVTQENGTEPAFKNPYWNNKKAGIYVDVVSGQPLFSSTHKYNSKTGWPSFYQPINHKNFIYSKEWGLLTGTRYELKSSLAKSHLGHVFNDGPSPTYKRFCINSAALIFIPKDKMQAAGYGDYLYLFETQPN